jgi:tetratricopeptide (TPR) repeat protein
VFALQDKVTQKIVTALAVSLTAGERERKARKETDSPEAYDAFLRGWAHYLLYTPEDFAKSVPYFEEAIQLDPNYGRAHAALANVYWESWNNEWVKRLGVSYAEAGEKATRHLEEALKEPTPLAHRIAANMHITGGRWDEAIAEAERAIALDANDPNGYAAMSRVLVDVGRPAEGLEFIERAMRLDPQSDYLYRLGDAQFHMERYDEAATTLLRATKRNPGDEWRFIILAAAYGQLGREEEAKSAIATFNKLREQVGQRPYTLAYIDDWWFKDLVARERLREGLRKAGLPEGKAAPRVAPLTAAEMRSLFPGNTLTGQNVDGERWHAYFAPDGKMFGRMSTGQTDEGTWEITDDGKDCEQYNNWSGGRMRCFINFKKGDEYEYWYADGSRKAGTFKIRPGNPENLGTVP